MCFVFGPPQWYSGLNPGSSFRNHSRWDSEEYMRCQEWNWDWLCTRLVPYSLYYLSSPWTNWFFFNKLNFKENTNMRNAIIYKDMEKETKDPDTEVLNKIQLLINKYKYWYISIHVEYIISVLRYIPSILHALWTHLFLTLIL